MEYGYRHNRRCGVADADSITSVRRGVSRIVFSNSRKWTTYAARVTVSWGSFETLPPDRMHATHGDVASITPRGYMG